MKKFSIISIITGAFLLVVSFIVPYVLAIVSFSNSPSIGIIGGAGGPTLNFLYRNIWLSSVHFPLSLLGIAAIITGIISLIFKNSIIKNCNIKSSVYALSISALISLIFYCFIAYIFIGSWHDINVTFSVSHLICILLALFSLIGCIILGISYAKKYMCDKKYKCIIFDIGIIIVFFVPFFMLFSYIHSIF